MSDQRAAQFEAANDAHDSLFTQAVRALYRMNQTLKKFSTAFRITLLPRENAAPSPFDRNLLIQREHGLGHIGARIMED